MQNSYLSYHWGSFLAYLQTLNEEIAERFKIVGCFRRRRLEITTFSKYNIRHALSQQYIPIRNTRKHYP
jgi:hypothetical protein